MTQTDPADLKQRLLEAALTHIPFEGMNDRALDAAARDLGLAPAHARVWFPQGGASLAAAIHRAGDARLRDWMQTAPQDRIRDRITDAVWQRLQFADPELVRAASAVLALPQNAGLAARLIWETADAIWDGLGDTSRDVNWYSKRATLAGVYSATALYWLGDSSPGLADTREFLDRRIDEVMGFEKLKANLRRVPGMAALTSLATGWIRAPGAEGADAGQPAERPNAPAQPRANAQSQREADVTGKAATGSDDPAEPPAKANRDGAAHIGAGSSFHPSENA
ncbi:MAG: COQ9 family protein [Paracoccus sp. (in: a-proteobacteria)]|nr:COQ9 family protein [Paracoccus sp. (in: a-proteobacteria)]